MTKIAIDRASGTVEKIQGFSIWKKRSMWNLGWFDAVRFAAQPTVVEDGYGTILYSVFLEAAGVSLELLSTDDEEHARSLHRELKELLAIRESHVK